MLNRVEFLRAVCVGRGMYASTHTLDLVFRILLVSRTVETVIGAEIRVIALQVEVEPREDITVTKDVDDARVEDPVRPSEEVAPGTIRRQVHPGRDRHILRERRTPATRTQGSSSHFILAWSPGSGKMFRPWVRWR